MVRHHLPPELATPARAYLAAFLGEGEAADAMHEVVDDVTYWGDDSLPAVLATTHSVLLSRMRVAPDAAASWLVQELGLDPATAGQVTGADGSHPAESEEPAHEPDLVRGGAEPVPVRADPARAESVPVEQVRAEPLRTEPEPEPERPAEGIRADRAVRIGFEDDGPLPSAMFDDHRPTPAVRLLAGALLVGVLLVVAVLLLSR